MTETKLPDHPGMWWHVSYDIIIPDVKVGKHMIHEV